MGYTTSTIHGIEVPDSAEANNVPEDIGKVVTGLEGGSLIRRLTATAISNLSAGQRPAGLVVYNTTTGVLQISNGSTFNNVPALAADGAWTSYTPTLTASTTNPTNWTQTGRYTTLGKLVIAKFSVVAGASMTAGSGSYRIALPVNANVSTFANMEVGGLRLYDNSSAASYLASASINNTAYFEVLYHSGTGSIGSVSNAAPWTWASNDYIRGTVTYEAA